MTNEELSNELLKIIQKMGKHRVQTKLSNHITGGNLLLQYLNINKNKDITPGDISSELNISTARVATALNSLEDKAYITRSVDSKDKRKFLIKITPLGSELIINHRDKILKSFSSIFEQIGDKDANEFIRISQDILNIIITNKDEENKNVKNV